MNNVIGLSLTRLSVPLTNTLRHFPYETQPLYKGPSLNQPT